MTSEEPEFEENTLSLKEIDERILKGKPSFKFNLTDTILFLLYADRKAIKGRIKQQKEIDSLIEMHWLEWTCKYELSPCGHLT